MRIRLLLLVILLGLAVFVWKRTVGRMAAPPAAQGDSAAAGPRAAPSGPFRELAPCRDGYRAARSAADTARVDARQVTLTPLIRGAPPSGATTYTCGIWRLEMPEVLGR